MQRTRGRMGSLTETLEFDCGSTSSNATVDQQICWDGTKKPVENQTPQFMLSPGDMNPLYANSFNHEWKSMNNWRIGEPSSSGSHSLINNDEWKRELGQSSSTSADAVVGSRLEQHFESTNLLSLDNINTSPLCTTNSSPHSVMQHINLNASPANTACNMGQHLEHPGLSKSNGSLNDPIPPIVGSAPFSHPSGSNNMMDNSSVRLGRSLDAQHVSRKRKAVEGYAGQSSGVEGSSCSQYTESSAWHALPTQSNSWSSLSRPASSTQISSRPGLDVGNEVGDESSEGINNLNVAGSSNTFLRSSRLRINPSNQQDSIPYVALSNGSVTRRSTIPSSSPMMQSFCPVGNSLDLRSAPSADDMVPQSQLLGTSSPPLHRNMPSFRWSGSSSSRNSHLSNSLIWSGGDNLLHEEGSSRSVSRSMFEHPMFVPVADLRNSVRHPTHRASTSANLNISENVTSSLPTGSSSAVNPPSAPSWVSRPNPLHHPRRLSEYVRRSLLSSGSEAAGGFSNSNSSLHSAPIASSEPRVSSSRAGIRGQNQSLSRLPWVEGRGDSNFRLPYSLQTLAVSEGSSRLVSVLRSALGLMRSGGNIRFEDFMIFDHSVFSGMADIHDRHRDMRLDVDNMSYEELLALEERIGNVSTGLSEETILKLLKQRNYSVEEGSQREAEPCCVCQEEFDNGDDVGTLDCGHDYHSNCIKLWLMQKNMCPICKTTGLAT